MFGSAIFGTAGKEECRDCEESDHLDIEPAKHGLWTAGRRYSLIKKALKTIPGDEARNVVDIDDRTLTSGFVKKLGVGVKLLSEVFYCR